MAPHRNRIPNKVIEALAHMYAQKASSISSRKEIAAFIVIVICYLVKKRLIPTAHQ